MLAQCLAGRRTGLRLHPAPWLGATVLCGAALAPASLFGLGVALPDQDAFATARGNAFVATADDPAAVYYNPAGISQLTGANLSLGAYGIDYGSSYKSGTTSVNSQTQLAVLPQLFSTYSLPEYHLTLGLGGYCPYGLRNEWPATEALIASGFLAGGETGEIHYYTINPVVAWQVVPSISIAAGPTINYSQADLKEYPGFVNHFRGRDMDVGYNIGVLWHPSDPHSVGITYRSATDMNYSGHATVPAPPFTANTGATANYHFPQTLAFGYSFRPTPKWNFEADANWTDWTTLQGLTVKPQGAPPETLAFNWDQSWMIDFGATRYLGDGWRISGGYMYSLNSVPSSSFNQLIPDSDRHIFSLGVGKKYQHFSWDAAYQLGWSPSRTVSGDADVPANGTYEFLSHAISINLGYHF
jgi:long-chain fatty acid transport protein